MRPPLNGNPPISCDTHCHGYPATDWAVRTGTPVYAMHDGIFYRRGPYPELGKRDPGLCADVETEGLFSRSAHLSRYALPNGTPVKEGDLIGYSGNTGYSTGPHVHSYVIVNGVRWGVYEYLNSIGYQWPNIPTPDPVESEEPMSASYLFAPAGAGKPARYAIVGLDVPGGSTVTTVVAEAEVMGFVYGQQSGDRVGAPIKQITQAQLDTAITFYARERARKVAEERSSGGATDPAVIAKAVNDDAARRMSS